jgi:hypothetical protein
MMVRCQTQNHGFFPHAWAYFYHRLVVHEDDVKRAALLVSYAVSEGVAAKRAEGYEPDWGAEPWGTAISHGGGNW